MQTDHINRLVSSIRVHRYTHNEAVENPHVVSSLLNYLESKREDITRMMNAVEEIDKVKFKPKLEDRDPRKETAQDWKKIQGGKYASRVAVERGISYSQLRKRLIAFGYKKTVAKSKSI